MTQDTDVAFQTSFGTFVVELYNTAAPLTVANFLGYVNNPTAGSNYNGSFFHRLVAGFILQGGGYDVQNGKVATIPTAAPVMNEYSASRSNVTGTIAMAKVGSDPNSATDQFFFNLADNSSNLDSQNGGFTVFGRVVENYSVVQAIAAQPTVNGGSAFANLPVQGTVPSTGATVSNTIQTNVAVVTPIAGTQTGVAALDDATATPFSTVVLSDPGNTSGSGDTVTVTVEDASGNANGALGTLALPAASANGLTLSSSGAGVYTLSAAGAIAALQGALDGLVFTPAAVGASPVTITFDVKLLNPAGQGSLDNSATTVTVSHDTASSVGNATILGADGATRTLAFGSAALAAAAAPLLAGVTAANTVFVDAGGVRGMSATQTAAIVSGAAAATLFGGAAANETVAAGSGALAFYTGTGNGTVVAGGGADLVYLQGGNWTASLGGGADTIVAATGNDTLATGAGGSLVFLGAGASMLTSGGSDTVLGDVLGPSGASTVSAGSAADLVFVGTAPLDFIAGSGASTVVAGAGTATLFGGTSGGTLMFGNGATTYIGRGGADTLAGETGSITVQGGAGGGYFFGGTAGRNLITAGTGALVAIGSGADDVLTATGSAADLFAGGSGAETLTGAGSTGNNTFFAGTGPNTLIGGAGQTALVAGAGADLLVGGSGLTLFQFGAGRTAGGADTISGFDASHDFVKLVGYSKSSASVVQAAKVSGGSATIALSDGTQVTFAGVTTLNQYSFI